MKPKTKSINFNQDQRELTITLENFDGARLLMLQKAILLGIEEIGISERRDGHDYGDAVWNLCWLLKSLMLSESQTNVGLGGKAYKSISDSELVQKN